MRTILLLLLFALGCSTRQQDLRLAVAANFHATARELVSRYQQDHPEIRLELITASTGALAAQIRQGAPFDLLLAADSLRPRKLLQEGFGSEVAVYAGGKLLCWQAAAEPESLRQFLETPRRLAIANPQTAPYGAAARRLLEELNVWDLQLPGLVRGENISQTLQLAQLGGLDGALIAASQAQAAREGGGSIQELPAELEEPIVQAALRLSDSAELKAFWHWMLEDETALKIIREDGYVPGRELAP